MKLLVNLSIISNGKYTLKPTEINGLEFSYKGLDFILNFRPNNDQLYFTFKDTGMGFWSKDLASVWGKPTKENYLEIFENYINSSKYRKNIIENLINSKNETISTNKK